MTSRIADIVTLSNRIEQVPVPACLFCSEGGGVLAINSYLIKMIGLPKVYDKSVALEDVGIYWSRDSWDQALSPLVSRQSDSVLRKVSILANNGSLDAMVEVSRFSELKGPGFIATFEAFSSKRDVARALQEVENRYRATFENAAVGIAHVGVDGAWISANKRLSEMLGYEQEALVGMEFRKSTELENHISYDSATADLLSGKQCSVTLEQQTTHQNGDLIWVDVNLSLQRGILGQPDYFIAVVQEITARKQAQDAQAYLTAELAHRCKNLLTVVGSIASLLRSTSEDVDDYSERLCERILGLGRATDLIVDQGWSGAPIHQLCENCVEPFISRGDQRISFEGFDIFLSASAAQALGMALYELTTNSLKYGSLSVDEGSVLFSWKRTSNEAEIVFRWLERNGPEVKNPERKGFGSSILNFATSAALRGTTTLDYNPKGISWTLTCAENTLVGDF